MPDFFGWIIITAGIVPAITILTFVNPDKMSVFSFKFFLFMAQVFFMALQFAIGYGVLMGHG